LDGSRQTKAQRTSRSIGFLSVNSICSFQEQFRFRVEWGDRLEALSYVISGQKSLRLGVFALRNLFARLFYGVDRASICRLKVRAPMKSEPPHVHPPQ
jgi:hypothetical protein